MKKILLTSILLLSGCSTIQPFIDRFTIAQFDANEYALVNQVRTSSMIAKPLCPSKYETKIYVDAIYSSTYELKNYSEHLPKNDQTIKPVNLLFTLVNDLNARYKAEGDVNKTYCELKLQSISDAANSIQKAIAKRPRP
ncbi:MAG: hypothetical protein ACO28V_05255 [Chitinophagaceae bacterium]|jgi:hypothetical protein